MRTRLVSRPLTRAALAGCSPTTLAEPPPAVAAATPASAARPARTPRPAPPGRAARSSVATLTAHPLDETGAGLACRSVFFALDSALLQDADRPAIGIDARDLAFSPTGRVRSERRCDERGGREHDLALGPRRAGVGEALRLPGARAGGLEAVGPGNERPVDPARAEAARAKSRRADLQDRAR